MFTAEIKTGEVLFASDESINRTQKYYCRGCKQRVMYKSGKKITSHFSHYPKEACQTFSEGETAEHLAGKRQLYDWLHLNGEKVEMEAYLPELKQRPDLLWTRENGTKVALEFQCSPLPRSRMEERTNGYLKNGYTVYWILGERFHIKKKLTDFQKCFMTELDTDLIGYVQYSVAKKKVEILSQFVMKGNRLFSCNKQSIFVKKMDFSKGFELVKNHTKTTKKIPYQEGQMELHRLSFYQTEKTRSFFKLLYEQQESIRSLPLECYECIPYEWMIDTYSFEWKYRVLKWIQSFQPKRVITQKMLMKWITTQEREQTLQFQYLPLVTKNYKYLPIYSFLETLTQSGIVKVTGQDPEKRQWTYNG